MTTCALLGIQINMLQIQISPITWKVIILLVCLTTEEDMKKL